MGYWWLIKDVWSSIAGGDTVQGALVELQSIMGHLGTLRQPGKLQRDDDGIPKEARETTRKTER